MLDIETVKKHLLGGKPTKYNEEKHISLLSDIFCKGGSVAEFCANALIDKKTFYNWLKAHSNFKGAYEVLVNIAEMIWENKPLNTPVGEFNYLTWKVIMKNRFGFGNPRIDLTESKTANERMGVIYEAVRDGALSSDEIGKLANLVDADAGISQGDAAIEISKASREEKLKLLAIYDKGIEDLKNN